MKRPCTRKCGRGCGAGAPGAIVVVLEPKHQSIFGATRTPGDRSSAKGERGLHPAPQQRAQRPFWMDKSSHRAMHEGRTLHASDVMQSREQLQLEADRKAMLKLENIIAGLVWSHRQQPMML